MPNNRHDGAAQALEEMLRKGLINPKPLFCTGTTTYTSVNGFAIYGIEDCTFTTLNMDYEGTDPATLTLPAGHIWYGPIVGTVELLTGEAIVYQHNKSGN